MYRRTMHKVITVAGLLTLMALPAGCAGNAAGPVGHNVLMSLAAATANSDGTADLESALAEIDALAAPADVDNAVFAELKAELGRILGEPAALQEGIPTRNASAAGNFQIRDFQGRDNLNLRVDTELAQLSWLYSFNGDYDQNGEVTAADLIPLASQFGQNAHGTVPGNRFEPGSLRSVVDGNADGLISLADIVPIAQSFGNRFMGFDVYSTDDLKTYPWHSLEGELFPDIFQDLAEIPVGSVELADASVLAGGQKFFQFELTGGNRNVNWVARNSSRRPKLHSDFARLGSITQNTVNRQLRPGRDSATQLSYDPLNNSITYYFRAVDIRPC